MSFSDHLRSFWDKKKGDEAPESAEPLIPPTPPIPPKSAKSHHEVHHQIELEKGDADAKVKSREKEIQDIRANVEKLELETKNRREEHQQAAQLLRMDAEREIKYLERKLQEDSAAWSKQLSDREKALAQAARLSESGNQAKQADFDNEMKARQEALLQSEAALREQQAKLTQERQKWQDLLRAKDSELISLKQELSRREGALEEELKSQETQQKAAQELWETRLKELEKQWTDKRKAWEDAMKATEEERLRLHNSFQERQAGWQLDQHRRLQEIGRREERAAEKLAALQAHFSKESQNWKQMVQSREEEIKGLRVKLLLSETDVKGRAEQAQKIFQEKVVSIAQQVQTLQTQLNEEQTTWRKSLEAKESEIVTIRDQVAGKLRQMEQDYSQKMSELNVRKENLSAELQVLKTRQSEQQRASEEKLQTLKSEQTTLETAAQQRLSAIQKATDQETLRLQGEIQKLEQQKDAVEHDIQERRQKAQEEIRQRDDALKAAQSSLAEQESVLRSRYAPDEETLTRQVEALKTRQRTLDREITKTQENVERIEKEHAAAAIALRAETESKEEDLKKRCDEQEEKLKKRLDERRISLEAFMVMKKDEETRLHQQIKTKEKERAELTARLEQLPKVYEHELKEKRDTTKNEIEIFQKQVQKAEQQLLQSREQAKSTIQAKAGQMAALRQSLDSKQKELSTSLKTREEVLASERAAVEKQLTQAQAEMDRVRTHWQEEITKKELESKALEEEIRRQETLQREGLEREQKVLNDQIAPLEKQRIDLTQILEREKLDHDQKVRDLEKQNQDIQATIQRAIEQAHADEKAQDTAFREDRARLKARVESLISEQEAVAQEGKQTHTDKSIQREQLEEQLRQQAVAHETRKRELIHSATVRSRTLQDILRQLESELKSSREAFPQDLRAKEDSIALLTQELTQEQARHQKMLARYDRAIQTLTRRGHDKEEKLRSQIEALRGDWAKKLAGRDSEIGALQSDLIAKDTERQGELDRLAKQFAEERFQLEKGKEELEWKLKDHKEVSERQLAGREKELRFLETEITRVKTLREQQIGQKAASFEAEKQKIQTALTTLQTQSEDERKANESALAAKERELQAMAAKSKQQLIVLGEEFNQKVNSWKSTNEALRGHIEQLKQHWTQAQDRWEAIRKEKAGEIGVLRQELNQWEARLQNDVQVLERAHEQERQGILSQLRKKEKDFEESQALFTRKIADKEDDFQRAVEDIRVKESTAEAQWRSSLEQWQSDKNQLDQEKVRVEQELIQMQSRSERELREADETIARLRVDVTFKESETHAQQERLKNQNDKDLQPLRDQVTQLTSRIQQEKAAWESKLQSKENDAKVMKTRLAWREKRLQEEIGRRQKELSGLQQTAAAELQKVRTRYDAEKKRLETQLKERREALAALQSQQVKQRQHQTSGESQAKQSIHAYRKHLEDSVKQLEQQHADMRQHYETLLSEKEAGLEELEAGLISKDAQLQATRQKARKISDQLRKEVETIQQLQQTAGPTRGGRLAPVWAIFEQAIHHYKSERWLEAAELFQECVHQDPTWSAAYQYLALVYHALGQPNEAAWAAEQALEKDPHNVRLADWANSVRATLNEKQRPAA